MEILRIIAVVGLLATMLGFTIEFTAPAADSILGIAAVVIALVTWLAGPLMQLRYRNRPARTSLVSVGRAIGIVAMVSCLSIAGICLAVITLAFPHRTNLAWLALLAIAAYWPAAALLLYALNRWSPQPSRQQQTTTGHRDPSPG